MSAQRDSAGKLAREFRLEEIRREAERTGRVQSAGVRLAGSPFPVASPQSGYYGIPLLKQPQWRWEVPAYFFVGGAAGASAVMGAVAHWSGSDLRIARDCRYLAAGGAVLSSALLISDLGRRDRFLNMLRVFKAQSPMSVGAWLLAAFGTFSGAAAFAEWLHNFTDLRPIRVLGDVAEGFSCLFGLPFSNYTGVLIGATVIPVWNEHVSTLPLHFGMSGLNSAVSLLELMGHERSRPLNWLGVTASAIESAEGVVIETNPSRVTHPLKYGASGLITRTGGMLSGPIPLALRVASLFVGARRARGLRRIAAGCSIAGSILTRIAWIRAGHASAQDWRLPLDIGVPQVQPMLSKPEHPQVAVKEIPA